MAEERTGKYKLRFPRKISDKLTLLRLYIPGNLGQWVVGIVLALLLSLIMIELLPQSRDEDLVIPGEPTTNVFNPQPAPVYVAPSKPERRRPFQRLRRRLDK